MRIVIQREGICNHYINTCERCLGIVIQHPEGTTRPCILEQDDDGSDVLTLIIRKADGQEKAYALNPHQQELLVSEGWQYVLDSIDERAQD